MTLSLRSSYDVVIEVTSEIFCEVVSEDILLVIVGLSFNSFSNSKVNPNIHLSQFYCTSCPALDSRRDRPIVQALADPGAVQKRWMWTQLVLVESSHWPGVVRTLGRVFSPQGLEARELGGLAVGGRREH